MDLETDKVSDRKREVSRDIPYVQGLKRNDSKEQTLW